MKTQLSLKKSMSIKKSMSLKKSMSIKSQNKPYIEPTDGELMLATLKKATI